jgi:hypothetical protein
MSTMISVRCVWRGRATSIALRYTLHGVVDAAGRSGVAAKWPPEERTGVETTLG